MARCGRCGLWSPYPKEHKEKKFAGTCLWFQTRLIEDEVFESRSCAEYFERVPNLTPMENFAYKIRRDDLGKAYREARRAKFVGYTALVISLLSILVKLCWNGHA